MYKGKRFLALIPARGGSKGIPGKNLVEVQGKSLIQYSIEAAKKSNYIDQVVVSTDSEEIQSVAMQLGAKVPFLRPPSLATDTSKTIDAVVYTVDKLKEVDEYFDYVALLQPTQPLRQPFHIDEAIEALVGKSLEAIVSVSPVQEHPLLMRTMNEDGSLQPFMKTPSTVRRQDFTKVYRVNGAIYIAKIDESLRDRSLNDIENSYVMSEEYDADIDVPFDLEVFKLKLVHLQKKISGGIKCIH
ncbi:CMP-N,N'-diacetyllegionaminic acid synthase [Evansella caseinilytica]|uniref:CMP-N,N'-diacetyllegionaminic acid synthase n=1 Tax=Evansella caseinilytica TaxID=1503961 RepID=A0A1H3TA77_9BACI|nr:acylneuraminate cytidylyltransferase family protein [Evansella caseinilytica]SDZ46761.1 CMP-N,N'-diacetyllegionaminic acid synthase [Evansella caseinilytica]